MPYRIINSSAGPVLLRLRSGRTLHLRSGAQAADLESAEVNGNPRIAALVERRLVTVEEEAPAASTRAQSKRAASSARKRAASSAPAPAPKDAES
jgi:hypothetical protein